MFSFLRQKSANVRMGKPDTKPDAPSHTAGVKQGNARGNFDKEQGLVSGADADLPESA